MKDYEQLYYDEVYKNRKLKDRITELEQEIADINLCRTKKNIDLQKYILQQLKKKNVEAKDENNNTINDKTKKEQSANIFK